MDGPTVEPLLGWSGGERQAEPRQVLAGSAPVGGRQRSLRGAGREASGAPQCRQMRWGHL